MESKSRTISGSRANCARRMRITLSRLPPTASQFSRIFDKGAAQFPRSDYRPSWLYWSGRAAQQAGDVETAIARLRLAATDYHNSYYGRLAVKRLAGERGGAVTPRISACSALPSISSMFLPLANASASSVNTPDVTTKPPAAPWAAITP